MIKLGSKLFDREDIKRRKELATIAIALAKNDIVWKKKWKTKLTTRIKLSETLVKSVLLYNCGTWGVSKDDQRKLNSFHRNQLRKVIGIQWPRKISNEKLYKITGTKPLSITITERRWKLLGHILRLANDCPARKAMRYYFEERTNKVFRGRRRTTIVTTLNEDIKRTRENDNTFPVTPLISQVSLQSIYTKAKNRKLWKLVKDCKTSCKFGLFQMINMDPFHCDWKEKRQQRRKRKNDVCRAKVSEFFSFLCPLQLQ